MKTLTLFIMAGALAGAQEKPIRPSQVLPRTATSRTFAQSCESVYPLAVKIAVKNGWKIKDAPKPAGKVTAPEGVMWFAEGNRECDVYVLSSRVTEEKILRDIAAQIVAKGN